RKALQRALVEDIDRGLRRLSFSMRYIRLQHQSARRLLDTNVDVALLRHRQPKHAEGKARSRNREEHFPCRGWKRNFEPSLCVGGDRTHTEVPHSHGGSLDPGPG